MANDRQTFSRGMWTSVLGLVIQLALAVTALLTSFWLDNANWRPGAITLYALTWYLFAAIPIWALLGIIFNEHGRERAEALEAQQLALSDQKARIFDEASDDLAFSKRRLANLYKWGVPALAVAVAVFLAVIGLILLFKALPLIQAEKLEPMPATLNTAVLIAIGAAIAFIAFTLARYQAGMTKVKEWTLLRGGAGQLMGAGLVAGLLLVAAVLAYFQSHRFFYVLAIFAPSLMVLLAAEIVLSLLFGFYRPRKPGEIPKLPFDSRLLGWLISPDSFGRIISETLNYQFGIEVSRSWFYQLLSRSVAWLIVFGAGALLLASCIVVVGPEEQAIITTFGAIRGDDANAVKGPGLYFKWPWPISQKHAVATARIVEFSVGSVKERIKPDQSILWTSKHGEEEYMITASTTRGASNPQGKESGDSLGMALIGGEVAVQYRITDLLKHYRSANRPHDLLMAIADQHLSAYFASHDIDALLSRGRLELGAELKKRISESAAKQELGVEIVFVGVKGIHPPQDEVAESFLLQVGALQEQESQIEKAKQEATGIYADVAGSREQALRISQLIAEFNKVSLQVEELRLKTPVDEAAHKAAVESRRKLEVEIVRLIADSPGKAAESIYTARAHRWEQINAERSKALKFLAQLAAYNNSKKYYATKLYLDVLTRGLTNSRLYVNTVPHGQSQFQFDLTDEQDILPGIVGGSSK